jgi:hypothetical protein
MPIFDLFHAVSQNLHLLLVAVTDCRLLIHSQYFLILLPHCISPCFLWFSSHPFTRHFHVIQQLQHFYFHISKSVKSFCLIFPSNSFKHLPLNYFISAKPILPCHLSHVSKLSSITTFQHVLHSPCQYPCFRTRLYNITDPTQLSQNCLLPSFGYF